MVDIDKKEMFIIGACTRIGPGLDCCASEICERCDDPPERLLKKAQYPWTEIGYKLTIKGGKLISRRPYKKLIYPKQKKEPK